MSTARTLVRLLILAPVLTAIMALPAVLIMIGEWFFENQSMTPVILSDFKRVWSIHLSKTA